jgi:hypothetical protein
MAHLVKPLHAIEGPLSLSVVLDQLREAHRFLAFHGMLALRQTAQDNDQIDYWGTNVKRTKVLLPSGDRPELIDASIYEHSLTEVYNQCATMERMIDAMRWALETLPDYGVLRCHPTTSSQKANVSDIPDNDLVLVGLDGRIARFEVSDIANRTADSNNKLKKELDSLGITDAVANGWPTGRLFIVVSAEFATLVRKRSSSVNAARRHFVLEMCYEHERTCIFEAKAQGFDR